MKIEVWSDGSGMTKATPAGYGFVVTVDGVKAYEGNGHIPFGTNNDAELLASISGLDSLSSHFIDVSLTDVTLVSDSQIILNWASGKNDFKQLEKIDKYDKLMALMKLYCAKTRWVKGHAGNEFNERCDVLANAGRLQTELE